MMRQPEILTENNPSYSELLEKLYGMYNSLKNEEDRMHTLSGIPAPRPIETFYHTLKW